MRTSSCLVIVAVVGVLGQPAHAQADRAALDRMVASLLPQVEQLSGLAAKEPLRVAVRSRDELRTFLEAGARREAAESDYRHARVAYQLLGLLPDTIDLLTLLPELLVDQIAGYYDFRTDTLFILNDLPSEGLRAVVAHEMTHALQDQHFGLDTLVLPARGNDAQLAARAAIEGHATLVMLLIQLADIRGAPVAFSDLPDFSRLPLEALMPGRPTAAFANAPRLLRESGAFPYGRGLGFAHALRAVDAAAVPFGGHLPLSTEQVMDPRGRFLEQRDDPAQIAFIEEPPTPWRAVYENALGKFELSILLMERHRLQSEAIANGWDGDRYRLLTDGEHFALEWFLVWDDPRAASRFVTTYTQILRTRMGRSAIVERLDIGGRAVVRVVEADDAVEVSTIPRARITVGG